MHGAADDSPSAVAAELPVASLAADAVLIASTQAIERCYEISRYGTPKT